MISGESHAEEALTADAKTCAKEQPAEKLWTPLFVLIIAATLCCFVVGQGLNSGTSVFIDRMGGNATFAGVLAAVFSIAAAVTRLVCGPLIDRTGRFRVMVLGSLLLLVGTLIPVFCADDAVFTLCRVIQGVGFSAATTASATAAADVLPFSRLGEGIGYYGLGQALAMSIGPALALFLVATDPAVNLYLGLTAIAAACIAFTLCCRYEHNPSRLPATAVYRQRLEQEQAAENANVHDSADATQKSDNTAASKSFKEKLADVVVPTAMPGMLPMLILSPAFGFGIFFVGLYGTSLGVGNPGLFYTLSAVSMILVRLKSKSFMDRVAPIKVFTVSTLFGLVGFTLLFFASQNDLVFYAAGIVYGVCLGISLPLNQSVAVKNTPAERWGAANAIFLLANDIGIGFGSAIWGIVNDLGGFTTTICCVMACIVASYIIAWIVYPKETAKH